MLSPEDPPSAIDPVVAVLLSLSNPAVMVVTPAVTVVAFNPAPKLIVPALPTEDPSS